jgi:hypothetical protein
MCESIFLNVWTKNWIRPPSQHQPARRRSRHDSRHCPHRRHVAHVPRYAVRQTSFSPGCAFAPTYVPSSISQYVPLSISRWRPLAASGQRHRLGDRVVAKAAPKDVVVFNVRVVAFNDVLICCASVCGCVPSARSRHVRESVPLSVCVCVRQGTGPTGKGTGTRAARLSCRQGCSLDRS